MKMRLLPVTIGAALLVLTLKIGDVWQSAGAILGSTPATAAEHETADGAEPAAKTPKDEELDLVERLAIPDVIDVSPTEIRMLEDLLGRRTELDKWEKDLDIRERLLAATEVRIDGKIKDLKTLNSNIETMVNRFNSQEDQKILRLVKIYESMKPKDAARIFNDLDMTVLIDVLSRMREGKAALVIAKMNSRKANLVTSELVVRRSLTDEAQASIAGANALN